MSDHKDLHYFLDGQRIDTTKPEMTASEIKASLPGLDITYQLFLEETGDTPDRPLQDGEKIDLRHRIHHFYAVPPATFGRHDTV